MSAKSRPLEATSVATSTSFSLFRNASTDRDLSSWSVNVYSNYSVKDVLVISYRSWRHYNTGLQNLTSCVFFKWILYLYTNLKNMASIKKTWV